MYFLLSLVCGVLVGAAACLPQPHKSRQGVYVSLAMGAIGAALGFWAAVFMNFGVVSPLALVFVSIIAATAAVAVYQMATAEPPVLR